MREPVWVREDVVIAVHRRQLAEHGGGDGLRDMTLLESALAKPQNMYIYEDPKSDLGALAAAYAYGICTNHPFVDGNKRTALVICRLFLKLNGTNITASQTDKYQTFMDLAASKVTQVELQNWIAENLAINTI